MHTHVYHAEICLLIYGMIPPFKEAFWFSFHVDLFEEERYLQIYFDRAHVRVDTANKILVYVLNKIQSFNRATCTINTIYYT